MLTITVGGQKKFQFYFHLTCSSGVPYGSINDYYDTNYEYEYGDDQVREEVLNTRTPQLLSKPLDLVSYQNIYHVTLAFD